MSHINLLNKPSLYYEYLDDVGDNDYTPVVITLTFQDSEEQLCVNVTITDDQTLESNESFTVRPNTSDVDVIIASSTATLVEIDDNDSKRPT